MGKSIKTRGMCAECEFYKFVDDGNELTCRCFAKSKRGKTITWAMYTLREGSFGNWVVDTEELKRRKERLLAYPETHKEPWWCPKKRSETE
jgi:hypothetical protein